MLTARRHKVGIDRWSVLFDGKLLIEKSRDPETDAARALVAMGVTGKLTMQDKDGRPLCVIDIEKAAKVEAVEDGRGPRFVKFKQRGADQAPGPEGLSLGREVA